MDINMADLLKQVAEDEHKELDAYAKGEGEAPIIFRQVTGAVTKAEAGQAVEFTLSHESDDRMGDIIRQDGWDLSSFKRNPVMLWAHDSTMPPIGKWADVRVEGKALVGKGIFDTDPFSASIESKVRRGFLNAVSVGFRPTEFKTRDSENPFGSFDFIKAELLETSVVPIPAHPKALRRALAELDEKRVWSFAVTESGDILAVPAGVPTVEMGATTGDSFTGATTTTNGTFTGWQVSAPRLFAPVVIDKNAEDDEHLGESIEDELDEIDDELNAITNTLDAQNERIARLEKMVLTAEADGDEQPSSEEAAEADAEAEDEEPDGSANNDETFAYREEVARLAKSLRGENSND